MKRLDSLLRLRPASSRGWSEHVVHHLALALKEQALYGASHPAFLQAVEEVVGALSLLLDEGAEFRVGLSGGAVLADGQALSGAKGFAANLVQACAGHDTNQIIFSSGVGEEEVAVLVKILCERPETLREHGGPPLALTQAGVAHICCETPPISAEKANGSQASSETDSRLLRTYSSALEVLQESTQQARLNRMLNASAAQTLASQLADNMIEDRTRLLGLLSIRSHDEYTFQHSLNICILALALGMAIGLDRARIRELGLAAFLHDVGKARVPLEVLRKPGPLSDEEFALIKRHPVDGAIYLSQQPELPPAVAVVAFQHHLRYDQNGYPRPRRPQSPNAYSLIVGIADAYEALTSERPYRPTLGSHEALRVMLDASPGQFEPRILAIFVEMLGNSDSHLDCEQ